MSDLTNAIRMQMKAIQITTEAYSVLKFLLKNVIN